MVAQNDDPESIGCSITHIEKLPDDILRLIMEASRPSCCENSALSVRRTPINNVLSAISQRWRTLALSTPSLWTIIRGSVDNPSLLQWTEMLLERSHSLPLEIHLDLRKKHTTNDHLAIEPLIHLLSGHSARWQRVAIFADSSVGESLSALRPSPVPVLKELIISLPVPSSGVCSRPLFDGGTPSLLAAQFLNGSHPLSVSLENVTTLKLEGWHIWSDAIRKALEQASSLVSLSLTNSEMFIGGQDFLLSPVNLPSVRVLSLEEDNVWQLPFMRMPLLDTIYFPYDCNIEAGLTMPKNRTLLAGLRTLGFLWPARPVNIHFFKRDYKPIPRLLPYVDRLDFCTASEAWVVGTLDQEKLRDMPTALPVWFPGRVRKPLFLVLLQTLVRSDDWRPQTLVLHSAAIRMLEVLLPSELPYIMSRGIEVLSADPAISMGGWEAIKKHERLLDQRTQPTTTT